MKTWKIPVSWTMMSVIDIEANTLAEAIEIARDDDEEIPIPDDGTYVSDSWEVDDFDLDFIREIYNNNQADEYEFS